jgi:kinesin family protein 18/19
MQEAFFDRGMSNMLVAIRVRPLHAKEFACGDRDVIRAEDKLLVMLDFNDFEERKQVLHRSREQRFVFDRIFKDKPNELVYLQTAAELIQPVLSGINACVFAYGPTGSGKTYTMLGNTEDLGICVLTIRDLYSKIMEDTEKVYDLKISYVEIYNEAIRDLLTPNSGYLELRDDPVKGVVIAGVTEFSVESTEQIINLLTTGNKRRTTEATNANQTSSRSHAIFQILVEFRNKTANTQVDVFTGKLSLIDLAGSERGTVTENRGIRLWEGAKINRSLLALANCINALGDKTKKGSFVPYRDSKLTRMLKDSLGGNCKTVMIANISPASSQFEETANTLKYASRAKNIKTKVQPNKKMVALHISEYKNIIYDLRSEIENLKSQLHKGVHPTVPVVVQENCLCSCGRAQDEQEMRRLQAEIFENFQERIQLRRALLELEEQNALNALEIKRRQAEVLLWKRQEEANEVPAKDARPTSAVPQYVQREFKAIQTLKASTDNNLKRKELMILQLKENMVRGRFIRDSVDSVIKFQDRREYLELLIKNHILEQTNVEQELQLQIQEKTLNDLQSLVIAQRKLLSDHGIDDGSGLWQRLDAFIPEMSVELDDDLEEVTEEQLQAKGYEFEPIEDEEEEEEVILEEDEFEVDFLLATSKAGADIDKTEEPLGFMLQGRSLIRKPVQEPEKPVKAEPPAAQSSHSMQASAMGLMINGKAVNDGLELRGAVLKPKPKKKPTGLEAYRKKK